MGLQTILILVTLLTGIFLLTFYINNKQKKKLSNSIKQEPRFDNNYTAKTLPINEMEDTVEENYEDYEGDPQANLLINDPLLQPREPIKKPVSYEPAKKAKPATEEIMYIMLVAKPDRPYVGYELLQSLLSAGLRFGAMDLFHRYEDLNGKGKILFSLASASETGTFEINKMGAYSGKGLMIFLRLSSNKDLTFAFDTMLETARELIEDLGGEILDEERKVLSPEKIERLRKKVFDFEQKQLTGDLFDEQEIT